MKTKAEVEALKVNWMSDPIWDIEETKGFEEYKEELKVFRLNLTLKWQEEKIEARANAMGCKMETVRFLEKLEATLEKIALELELIRKIQDEVHPVFWDRNGGTERRMR